MKVIIGGAGQVGWQIARHLSVESNDVTVIDSNPDLIRLATDTLDVQGIAGYASYPDVLERAGAHDADMIIAATYSDEVNIVTCQVAHSVFEIKRKIARLRAQAYIQAAQSSRAHGQDFGIDVVISPEREVAAAAMQRLSVPAAFDIETFMRGKAQLLGITIEADCPVINTPLRQLTDMFSTLRVVVVGVRRANSLFSPNAIDQLFVKDDCYLLCHADDVDRTMKILGKTQKTQERVVIVGAGNVGLAVASEFETKRVRGKVIEHSREQAERAAEILERTIVLNGDGLDSALLREAAIDRADAMLAVTDDDKTNMLAAVRAKAEGCPVTISLVNDPTLIPLMDPLGIDAYINPRAITVSSILRHIRQGRVRQVYSIGDAEAEVIEAEVLSTSPIANQRLRDIDFPEGVLVGAIEKNGEISRPQGSTRIEQGDVLAIFAMAEDIPEVERLLQVSIDFF
ncbi:MAG: Trk system potassium transporter TrkA [Aestuariivita sp.]|nr:Trk system potassium transporter TrkA [Aestuariivita sp.]MCY4347069.1 Trk system potassium transporter TrkA [Aestuariivita sp.]